MTRASTPIRLTLALLLAQGAALTQGADFAQPAAALATQIASILAPGPARLTIRNSSTLSVDEIPAIRRHLEADLRLHGIAASGAESANMIRVTLSENIRERLWVAEVIEGSETRVAMVHLDRGLAGTLPDADRIALRKDALVSFAEVNSRRFASSSEPVLAAIEMKDALVVLRPSEVSVFAMSMAGWQEIQRLPIPQRDLFARDPRGSLAQTGDDGGFISVTPGEVCMGRYAPAAGDSGHSGDWSLDCHESDDPWPILQPGSDSNPASVKAFYNAARNYFTGVVTPSFGVDLPPFYSAALVPRPSGGALLIGGIDGKVLLAEKNALKPVAGTRDWGSDFAAIRSGCGSGTQIVASAAGEAAGDSLRAYDLLALEAIPASAALAMDGEVTALSTAQDSKSVYAVVLTAGGNYEVDRVTATCN